MQLGTAFSDFVLAVAALYGIFQMTDPSYEPYIYAIIGYAIISVGALLGIIRFVCTYPPCCVKSLHRGFTWLGASVGLALIASQMYYTAGLDHLGLVHLVSGVLLFVVKIVSDYRTSTTLSEFVSAISAISILLLCLQSKNVLGCLGALTIILVGLIAGLKGRSLCICVVELFHYGFSFSLFSFTRILMEGKRQEVTT